MEFKANYITPDIKLSTFDDVLFRTEMMFDYHLLVLFISGETRIIQASGTHVFKAGDIFLVPRNQLATIINYPTDGLPHKAVVFQLTVGLLSDFYSKIDHIETVEGVPPSIVQFNKHPLLQSCLASVIPWFDMTEPFPVHIANMKIHEAISIIRLIHPPIDQVLANFDVPGKIDLGNFMETHYMFNMPLEKFGYLTGRSLSTFNRDFRKTYNTSPQKWLTQKRLELAHYHLREKKKKPSDVYLEVGFEDLSHFSFAFKKHFGYTPTEAVH